MVREPGESDEALRRRHVTMVGVLIRVFEARSVSRSRVSIAEVPPSEVDDLGEESEIERQIDHYASLARGTGTE